MEKIIEETEIIVKPGKKCKKNYTRFMKSINRGVTVGCKKAIKESIDLMDLSFLKVTSEAVNYLIKN